tara:strand:- start:132 stop:455 length:324 start_codon:yes stop_codon:yes gene_type:complete
MTVILGEKKKAVDLPLMDQSEIAELTQGVERMLEQGVPLEVPAAVRIADLIRITKTMTAYADLLRKFSSLIEEESTDEDMEALHADVVATLNPLPQLITPTPSRLKL